MINSKANIVVAGFIVGGPLGGLVWHHLQYVIGLQAMGHNVMFVEDSTDHPCCYHPHTHGFSNDASYGLAFISKVFLQFGLQNQWAYFKYSTNTWYGKTLQQVKQFTETADLFLNLSGFNPLRDLFLKIPIRIFLDTDPVFTQIRNLTEPTAFETAKRHNRFLSFGENFGKPGCCIPNDGFNWQPTRQPVYMDAWAVTEGDKNARWTTVMQWDSYKVRRYNGQAYGMKSASFDAYFSLPGKIVDQFELAIGSATVPKEKLSTAGWHIVNPVAVTIAPATYQQFIQQSKGEWSVAKHGYVASNSGWFSERSTCYLASGRPVVVQDTGLAAVIETGRGLFSFTSPDEAVAAIETINSNYTAHCKYAREIAAGYFSYSKVLSALLQHCNDPVAIK